MRTDLSATILAAAKNDNGLNLSTRMRIYRSRNWFTTGQVTTYAAAFAQAAGTIPTTVLPQDMKYDVRRNLHLTVMNNPADGLIYMGTSGRAVFAPTITATATTLPATTGSRPSVTFNETTIWIFFQGDVSPNIRRAQVNVTKLLAGDTDCITASAVVAAWTPGSAIHALDENTLVVFWIGEGGVHVTLWTLSGTTWSRNDWDGRFMHPENVFDSDVDADVYALNYSAAVRSDDKIYAYYTMPDGNVMGVQYAEDSGHWSDSFEAVPADLSVFACANALVTSNGRIHLTGWFQRQDIEESKFTSTHVYALDLTSDDGHTFSLDRTTAVGADTYAFRPFLAEKDPSGGFSTVTYGDANRFYTGNARWNVSGENAENYLIDDAINLSGGVNSNWQIRLRNADERQQAQTLLEIGTYARPQIGMVTGVSLGEDVVEWLDAQFCVITGMTEEYADGARTFNVKLSPYSAYKTAVMTHPFDIEIKSKQSGSEYFGEGDTEFQTLFKAEEEGFLLTPFMVDFWSSGTCEPGTNATTASTEYTTADIISTGIRSYPTIDALPFDIKMWGWSRSGNPTPYTGGTGDQPSDLSAPNDQIKCKLYVTHPDNSTAEITVTDISPSGTYNQFPQTWYATNAGNYPVILQGDAADGFRVGDQITKVGFIFSNTVTPNNAQTVFYPCRVEIPTISMQLDVDDAVWEPVTVAAPDQCSLELVDVRYRNGAPLTWTGCDSIACFVDTTGSLIYDGSAQNGLYMVFHLVNCVGYDGGGTANDDFACLIQNVNVSDQARLGQELATNIDAGYTPVYSGDATGIVIDAAGGANDTRYVGIDVYPAQFLGDNVLDGYFALRTGGLGVDRSGDVIILGVYVRPDGVTDPADYVLIWSPASCGDCALPVGDEVGQELQRIGIPTVYFSNKPYHSFNFEAAAKFRLAGTDGTNAYGGVVGLASSADDYILARTNTTTVELYKVRSGLLTLLSSAANVFDTDRGWISLKHQDGVFTVRTRNSDNQWTDPLITYTWTEANGALATDKDILHVGVYGLRDSPWARITSFDPSAGTRMGVLPLCTHWDSRNFPATGNLRMNQDVYSYTALVTEGFLIEGPYMGQNTGGYYDYTNDGETYQGKAAEFSRFEWVTNSANSADFDDYLQAYSSGVAWEMDAGGSPDYGGVDYKPFIFTEGVQVFLKNRGRLYSSQIGGDLVGNSVKCWLTGGFTGMRLVSGEPTDTHAEGTIAFLDNDAQVILLGFLASSGDEDAVLADMITKITAIADGNADFPGDIEDASQALNTSEWVINP